MKRRARPDDAVLITDAAPSHDDELAIRRRRYAILMGLRLPCLIGALLLYHIPWLAVLLLVLSIPLPWMAVLIANDRLPNRPRRSWRQFGRHRAIEPISRPGPVDEEGSRPGEPGRRELPGRGSSPPRP